MPDPRIASDQESLVTPTQIAALAGVGRAAVSNWRRRYPDFPQPAGGTVNSPLFDWGEVEAWLAANGRTAANTPESVETRVHHGLDLDDVATLVERLAYRNKP